MKLGVFSIPKTIDPTTSGPTSFIVTDLDSNPILFDQNI